MSVLSVRFDLRDEVPAKRFAELTAEAVAEISARTGFFAP